MEPKLEQPHIPEIGEEKNFLDHVEMYNKQYGMGAGMADAIRESMGETLNPKMKAHYLREKFSNLLDTTGVSLESKRSTSWKGFVSNKENGVDELEGREVRLNLADAKKYVQYLSSIDVKDVPQEKLEFINQVAESLREQVFDNYELGNYEDERWVELFGSLKDVINEYKRIESDNSNESVQKLEKYLEVSREGYLKEYILAEQANLLVPVGGSFTWQWYKDSTLDNFQNKYWRLALDVIKQVSKNPTAKTLLEDLKKKAAEAIQISRKEIPESKYRQEKGEVNSFLEVLDGAEEELMSIV